MFVAVTEVGSRWSVPIMVALGKNRTLLKPGGCGTQIPSRGKIEVDGLAEPDFGFDGHADAEDVVGVFALVEADADW
jgi:hypothetical protein